jgi:cytochrome oxidase Cu insertion factor (SCO1/SenC/PrrC family)
VNKQSETAGIGSGRMKMLLVAALFFLPLIAAIGLYQGGWRPQTQVNHGELVQPARPVADVTLKTLDGQDFRFSQLRKKWTMLYFGSAECTAACAGQLYKMRQTHIAQGADADRIQRVFVVTDPGALDLLRHTLKDYPDMQVLTGTAENIRQLTAQFQLPAGSPMDGLGRIYLVDPLGNFMMSYPAGADAAGLRKDLMRLLKVSHIG